MVLMVGMTYSTILFTAGSCLSAALNIDFTDTLFQLYFNDLLEPIPLTLLYLGAVVLAFTPSILVTSALRLVTVLSTL